ncbi:MAG: GTPase Era [Prochlorococcus sp. SP3034]|nr:GTPase Era [Prochlorococcus sp. SP3034]
MNNYKSGFVTLLGRPNVGKSTLINKLIGEKITITSPIAQTTRNKLKGILTTQKSQIIFVDTPGIHKPHHLLGEKLVKNAKSSIGGVDLILLIFDSYKPPGKGDHYISDFLISNKSKFIVVLNKWDLVSEENKKLRLRQYKEIFQDKLLSFSTISALSGEGAFELINLIESYLPFGPMLYPQDIISDHPLSTILSELVREQVLLNTREEVPHSVAVKIEKIQEVKKQNQAKNLTAILATIIVEKKSQKSILIGKNGSMLKVIGKEARTNMQKLIDGPVFLELFVKVTPNWRKKESKLIEFGYEDDI